MCLRRCLRWELVECVLGEVCRLRKSRMCSCICGLACTLCSELVSEGFSAVDHV